MNNSSTDISKLAPAVQQLLEKPLDQLLEFALARLTRQGELVTNVLANARGRLRDVLGATRARRIYLVGCGDSYSAALAARCAFEQLTGLPTMALDSMEFARYTLLPPESLVILVSSTGEPTMTLEAGAVARQAGVEVIGVTSAKEGQVAQEFPSLFVDPGFSSDEHADYLALIVGNFSFSLAALYMIAVHLGQGRGHLDDRAAGQAGEELERVPDAIERTASWSATVREYLESVSSEADFYFLGAGPNFGVARFLQAKFFEQVQRSAYGIEMEEFSHEYWFTLRPGEDAQVWFIVPSDPSQEWALDMMASCQEMGARAIAIAGPHGARVRERADLILPVEAVPEMFSPLVTVVPGEFLALHAVILWRRESFSVARRARQMAISKRLTRERTP